MPFLGIIFFYFLKKLKMKHGINALDTENEGNDKKHRRSSVVAASSENAVMADATSSPMEIVNDPFSTLPPRVLSYLFHFVPASRDKKSGTLREVSKGWRDSHTITLLNQYNKRKLKERASFACKIVEYTLRLLRTNMPDEKLEKTTVYIAQENNKQLSYVLRTPKGHVAKGALNIDIETELTSDILNSFKPQILQEISDKGHLQTNPALEEQREEIICFLQNESAILEKELSSVIRDCFVELKKPVSNDFLEFLKREAVLDKLNMEIICAKINKSNASQNPTHLDCSNCYLTRFPKEMITHPKYAQYWSKLERLFLYGNHLKNLPPEIGRLIGLKHLFLNENKLVSLPPEIGCLVALEWLYLSHNLLQNLPPEIGQLAALRNLDAPHNHLRSLPPETEHLAALKSLDLTHNHLQCLPSGIGQLLELQNLFLSYNDLQELPAEIGQLIKLKKLYLSHNKLQVLPQEIWRLVTLKWLFLSNNQLESLSPEIDQLRALEWLDVSHNYLQSLPVNLREDIILEDTNTLEYLTKAQVLASQKLPALVKKAPRP